MSDDQFMPCPFCGGTDLSSNEWWIDDDSEVQAVECNNCKAGAPLSVWNTRPSPWRYPERGDPMPEVGQKIVYTFRRDDGEESRELTALVGKSSMEHPMVRWMPIPPEEADSP